MNIKKMKRYFLILCLGLLGLALLTSCSFNEKIDLDYVTIWAPKIQKEKVFSKDGSYELRYQNMTLKELKKIEIRTDIRRGETK